MDWHRHNRKYRDENVKLIWTIKANIKEEIGTEYIRTDTTQQE